ncbi:SDR family oxidoreductase [Ilumatobacter sp.]|uniref:SDR family oxidoreductase n=1 Tax=Ilumatobacter sp. TaxID=1967498 RepID=UPI003B5240C6
MSESNHLPSSADLAGKTVVVIGASSGQGLAVSRAASEIGATVVMASRTASKLEAAVKTVGSGARGVATNMLDPTSITALFDDVGELDHLVVTAVADEVKNRSRFVDMTDEIATRSLDKFWGSFFASRAAAPRIRPGGSITLTSSIAAFDPPADGGFAMMNAASAAVATLGRSLAAELKPIRVNVIAPGVVDSGVWDSMSDTERDGFRSGYGSSLPVGHLGRPEELAAAFLYMMTNTYTTGSVLPVDGGALLT